MLITIRNMVKKNSFISYKYRYLRYIIKKRRFDNMSVEEKKEYLDKKYVATFGTNINWNNPKKLSEKIQYEKIYGKDNGIKTKLADKYEVRAWVKELIGEEYLIPLIGVYNEFKDIKFNELPKSFVIKCNHDSGSVTIVKDKSKVTWKKLETKYNYHMKTDYSKFLLEKQYSLITPKILIEDYIEDESGELMDYKFWCFNSKVYYCRVDYNRFGEHKRATYDLEWNIQPWVEGKYEKKIDGKKPKNFDKMIEIVEILCKGFPMVRIDLYNDNGKIYFGEMTFSSASGFEYIDPEYDIMLGELWTIENCL